MLNRILVHGIVAGLIVGVPLFAVTVLVGGPLPEPWGVVLGYLTMLIALSVVFIAIKRRRDTELGGVIRFWPAFGMGLAISLVASICYVVAWEAALAVTDIDFAGDYARMLIEQQRSAGATAAELAKLTADLEDFRRQYANPLFRIPMTLTEIFPVGVLVSLVSAAVLRNSRFMPNVAAAAQEPA
jgi:hypothetical protein